MENGSIVKKILEQYKKITVLGLSPDITKPSFKVPQFMLSKGYQIAGVYPKSFTNPDFKIYSSLHEVPKEMRKMIDVFRGSEKIPQIVDEILALGGCEVLWLQLGITHPEAEKKAKAAGLQVVSDKCLHIEYNKYF